jgi:two-component system, NtrC family, sensor kinase
MRPALIFCAEDTRTTRILGALRWAAARNYPPRLRGPGTHTGHLTKEQLGGRDVTRVNFRGILRTVGSAMNPEQYQIPTLALLSTLVAVFGALWLEGHAQPLRVENTGEAPAGRRRLLMWLLGWTFVVVRLALQVNGWTKPGLGQAVAQVCMQFAPLLFLGSLAPQYFCRKPRILFVAAFGFPVILYCVLLAFDPRPGPWVRTVLVVCALTAIWVAARWSGYKYLIPTWLSYLTVAAVGAPAAWLTLRQQYATVGSLAHSGMLLMSAMLFLSAFRRLTAGLVFTVGGMLLWALPAFLDPFFPGGVDSLPFARALNLIKVITAVGMIVLVLEDEIASNEAAQQRDRRARRELERYAGISLAATPFDEESREYDAVCAVVAEVSRFSQVAVFMQTVEGTFRLCGRSGIGGALEGALDALARRTTQEKLQDAARTNCFTSVAGNLMLVDLTPLMAPGDELGQMNFRRVHGMAVRTRGGQLQGSVLLAGLRQPEQPLATEDVLPLELLVARVGAGREHTGLLRRVMQSERLAGLGQLAGGVAHELNNPLQAVTGFAQLLAEGESPAVQHQAEVILAEARRMKQIIESLMRFRHAASSSRTAISVGLLLRDIEKLLHHDLEKARIRLELNIPSQVPRVKADGEQIRQVFLQVMRNAMASLAEAPEGVERRLNVEVANIPRAVEVMFSDSGPGFAEPGRAFDPFFTTRNPGEGVGLGLSICYAIVREHGGEISAVNLHPRGAAVVIELPAFTGEPDGTEDMSESELPISNAGPDAGI